MDPTIPDTSSSGSSSSEPDVPTHPEMFDIASNPDEDPLHDDLNLEADDTAVSDTGSIQIVPEAPQLVSFDLEA
jgi:hypothetical protein